MSDDDDVLDAYRALSGSGIPLIHPIRDQAYAGESLTGAEPDIVQVGRGAFRSPPFSQSFIEAQQEEWQAGLDHEGGSIECPTSDDLWLLASGALHRGDRFRIMREMAGLSREELHELCPLGKEWSTASSQLSKFEGHGKQMPGWEQMCVHLGVTSDFIERGPDRLSFEQQGCPAFLTPWLNACQEAEAFVAGLDDWLGNRGVGDLPADPQEILECWERVGSPPVWQRMPWWEPPVGGSFLSWLPRAGRAAIDRICDRHTIALDRRSRRALQWLVEDYLWRWSGSRQQSQPPASPAEVVRLLGLIQVEDVCVGELVYTVRDGAIAAPDGAPAFEDLMRLDFLARMGPDQEAALLLTGPGGRKFVLPLSFARAFPEPDGMADSEPAGG